MASRLIRNQLPLTGLRVRPPCPPLISELARLLAPHSNKLSYPACHLAALPLVNLNACFRYLAGSNINILAETVSSVVFQRHP